MISEVEICRACLCTTKFLVPFENYLKMFYECTNLKIGIDDVDDLPKNFCLDCIDEMKASNIFRNKCINSDKELRIDYNNKKFVNEKDFDINYISAEQIYNIATNEKKQENNIIAVFPCRKCFKYFISYEDLTEHNLEHPVQENMNACCYCGQKYQSMRYLQQHINKDHFEEHLIECGYCKFECNIEMDMGLHMTTTHQNTTAFDSIIDILNEAVQKTLKEHNFIEEIQLSPPKLETIQNDEIQNSFNDQVDMDTINENNLVIYPVEEDKLETSSDLLKNINSDIYYKTNIINIDNETNEIDINEFKEEELIEENCTEWEEIEEIKLEIGEISDENQKCSNPDRNFECKKCNKTYKNDLSYKKHITKCNNQTFEFECTVCNEKFKTFVKLQSHVLTHNPDKPFRCEIQKCKCTFKTEESLKTHLLVYHNNDDGKNQCVYCDKSYSKAKHLRAHMTIHSNKKFQCKFCPKNFHLSHHLRNHEKIHLNNRPYLCSECGKKFITKDRLSLHQRIHSNLFNFACGECEKKFKTKFQLDIHSASHITEKNFMCTICGLRFKLQFYLNTHMRKTHGNRIRNKLEILPNENDNNLLDKSLKLIKTEDNYCTLCHTSFESNSELTQHIKIHSFQYSCEICSKPFPLLSKLEQHLKSHEKTGVNFSCNLCSDLFKRQDQLRYHFLRKHTNEKPYKCDLCERGFIQSGDLKVHMRRHTGDRPFTCLICSKAFFTSTSLNLHKRIHSDEKPYKCNICEKSFRSSSSLIIHTKSHNKPMTSKNNIIFEDENVLINDIIVEK